MTLSNKARDWARFVEGLTLSESLVLRELAEYYNEAKGAAWPSIAMIQKGCNNINEKTVRRALTSLISQGHITRTQRGTRHQPSVYSLAFNRTLATIEAGVQPDIGDLSTGHLRPFNRTLTSVQPDIDVPHIRNEPLSTISEPLLEPVAAEFFNRTIKAYEENIGMITPMVADQIKAIAEEDDPPAAWGEDAIRIAVGAGARNWRYTAAILNRWIQAGSQDDRKGARDNGTGRIQGPGIDTLRGVATQSE